LAHPSREEEAPCRCSPVQVLGQSLGLEYTDQQESSVSDMLCLNVEPNEILILDSEAPNNYIQHFKATISIFGEAEQDIEIGSLEFTLAFLTGWYGRSWDLFDSDTFLCQYLEIFGSDETIRQSILNNPKMIDTDCLFLENILTIDRVSINPKYRGQDYGIQAIKQTIQHFKRLYPSSLGMVVLACQPQEDAAFTDRSETLSMKKLSAHYKKIGFVKLRGTNIMVHPTIFD
jgi:hypothetical protein